ncbi:MAG: FdhF/YdeP family oxidoreductase, partial [Chlorobiaceae bacterium]|nr:FdhF/YdeP family oxidoreductase [Chlorobiaceae bacterium]
MEKIQCARFTEEILLLALDDDTGNLRPLPPDVFTGAMAGAMLLELAFSGHIDNDLQHVFPVEQSAPVAPHLEKLRDTLSVQPEILSLSSALAIAVMHVPECLDILFGHLVEENTLKRQHRFITTSPYTYTKSDWTRVICLRNRIRNTVTATDLPMPGDAVIVSLMHACGLEYLLFSTSEQQRYRERIEQLARLELLGQQMHRAIGEVCHAPFERTAAVFAGLDVQTIGAAAGGVPAVMVAMGYVRRELGVRRSALALKRMNQDNGFDCPSCAWPEPETGCSRFEFCENGAKALASEATEKNIGPDFFARWSLDDLADQSGYWMEQQGRITRPMLKRPGDTHYRPVSYQEAFTVIRDRLNALSSPGEAVFYVCGHVCNEAAFLFQLLARRFGTNNLPNSANLCHEPSGFGMKQSLGYGKGDAGPEDLEQAGAIFMFGHNPGSNHPRMLRSLQAAARKGAAIVTVNPLPEAGLSGFANPKEIAGLLGQSTSLSTLHIPIRINGDLAFLHGMMKHLFEREERYPGSVFDHAFIDRYTTGLQSLLDSLRSCSWDLIEQQCGIDHTEIARAAEIYIEAGSVVATWGLGITQHVNGTDTVQHIINLMLLGGNIGRPGAGLIPMRGHSNILGIRSMGCGENMGEPFYRSLEEHLHFTVPRTPGLGVVHALEAMRTGAAKVCISLGGNLAASAPDTAFVAEALRACDLTVIIATKLNQSQAVTGKSSIILPCLGRSEIDTRNGNPQYVTVEDAMGCVHASCGCLPPAHPSIMAETRIVAEMAHSLFGSETIPWLELAEEYSGIRKIIGNVVPGYDGFSEKTDCRKRFVIRNPLRERDFSSLGGRALFIPRAPLPKDPASGTFTLMSIRSHDQFNTTIYGLDDRYRGIRNQRRIVFMNRVDMAERNIAAEQPVRISSNHEGQYRTAPPFHAIPYEIPRGCVAVYFPEANALVPRQSRDRQTDTP